MSSVGAYAHDRFASSSVILGSLVAESRIAEASLLSQQASQQGGLRSDGLSVQLTNSTTSASASQQTGVPIAVDIDRKAVWGLYCSWAMVGIVYGFVFNYINIPICEYVFGPMDSPGRTTTAQCNIAPSVTGMPWNFQVFYGLILDRVGFCGTRRIGWIIFGWTMALLTLLVLVITSQNLADEGKFFEYMIMLGLMCFFYIFATVSSDGMTIEFGKLEPPERRGYILTTGQMVRFASTILVNLLGILGMNGKYYYKGAKTTGTNDTIFPFELQFWQVHLVLLLAILPLYVTMICCLRDPPKAAEEPHHSLMTVVTTLWTVMKTKVMCCLVMFGIGSISIASLLNPAQNVIAFIANPSTFQISVGTAFGNVLFLVGVWIFRTFLINRNWRLTFIMTSVLLATNGGFQLLVIYNAWGIAQSGWFYAFGSNILLIIQGISQVLASLSVMEISPSGFEASVYEFLTSMQNSGISLNTNFQNIFLPIFSLNGIASHYKNEPANQPEYNSRLAASTYFTIACNVIGSMVFCWCLPKDKAQCKTWLGQWHYPLAGYWNLIFGGGVLFFSLTISILSALPATDCLQIAGGSGCNPANSTKTIASWVVT